MENMEKAGLKVEVPYREKVSRLFVFRGLWVFVIIWPLTFLAFWVTLLSFLGFWYMLFLGKRSEVLWGGFKRFFVWNMDWNAYFNVLTDRRPSFWW